MTLKSTTALVLAGVVLAGCGGGSSDSVSSAAFGGIYEPNFRGSGTEIQEIENGIVYFIGNVDGSVSEVRVTLDRDGTTNNPGQNVLLVEIDGGPVREFLEIPNETVVSATSLEGAWVAADGSQDEFNAGVGGGDLFSTAFIRINSAPTALGGFSRGFGGLETEVSDLPDNATYTGEFQVDTEVTVNNGTAQNPQFSTSNVDALNTNTTDTVVDFANGTVTGTHNGTSTLGTGGAVSGDISGSVSNTRVTGTLSVTGAAAGTLDFGGLATGDQAANIRGGVAGTLDFGGNAGSTATGGSFCLTQSGTCDADF